jgi:cell division protein FtsI/penicillin-binding protein 2
MRWTSPAFRSRRRSIAPALAALTLAAGLSACSSGGPDDTLDAFLSGWRSGKLDAVGFVRTDGEKIAAAQVATELKSLSGELAQTPPALRRDGDVDEVKGAASAKVTVDWTLPGGRHWTYPTTVRMAKGDKDWAVIWEPKIVNVKLTAGDRLGLQRVRAGRGGILDGAGQPIVAPRPVVTVGVEPRGVDDPAELARQLDAAFKAIRPAITPPIDLSNLPTQIREARDPAQFLAVVQLRKEAYLQIKPRIYELPGTKFREGTLDLAPSRVFARALLGSVDEAFKEDVDRGGGAVAAGDQVGHGGLQGALDQRLRGTAGTNVVIMRKDPDGNVAPVEGALFQVAPAAGKAVKTTLDVATQNAADAALAGERARAAIVALKVSDGSVLAVANGPGGGTENLAFTAQVPPGSTFKMVSAYGLLDSGAVRSDTVVDCPRTFAVDGRSFHNSENFELGKVPFHVDFAKSCNTAFASLAPKLGPDGLAAAGRSLGLEAPWDLGVDAFSGKVSTGGSGAERAAAAFGQGQTIVSPVAIATATAAVARGQWRQPGLLVDPAPAKPAAAGPALKASTLEPLRSMMREVVTGGTATALADAPGGAVYGKTGTAEAATDTHGWFIGWQGDVAFAVFVEKGGSSTASAVPLAEKFLRGLRG